jgi:chromosome segregation ATPase
MTFISEALYKSLKKEQDNLLTQISELTNKTEALTARLKQDQDFLDSYEVTKEKLEASISASEAQRPIIDKRIDEIKTEVSSVKNAIAQESQAVAELKTRYEDAVKEGRPQSELDALSASIQVAEGKVNDLLKKEESLKNQAELLEKQNEDLSNLIADSNRQLAENEARKDDLDNGGLADLQATLNSSTEDLATVNLEYADFKSKNQSTINSFEVQDEQRNKLIRVTPNRKIYNRPLPSAENSVIANEDNVLKEVVSSDLDIQNLTETEKELLNKAIEDSSKDNFDPNFLSAAQASDMARTANFSLLPVSFSIKEAAMNGLYSIIVQYLSDSNIYALEQAGYTVILTPNRLPEFEVRWDKIVGEEA